MEPVTPAERAMHKIAQIITDDGGRVLGLSITKIQAEIAEALTAAEERAQRAEYELKPLRARYETMHREYKESLAEAWQDAQRAERLARWAREQIEPEYEELKALAENPVLTGFASTRFLKREHYRHGYIGIAEVTALTPQGRERLAYLHGLVGEEISK
jgi:hypothetical protein